MSLWIKYIKKNKLTTFAILLSMVLSVALLICIFTIRNTDENLERLGARYNSEPYDVTFSNLKLNQAEMLALTESVEHLGFSGINAITSVGEKQQVTIVSANEDYIIRQSILEEGRMPCNENELVVEKWVIKNFGIEPKVGQNIKLKVKEDIEDYSKSGKDIEKEYKIVGIISDNPYDKVIGFQKLYTCLNIDTKTQKFLGYIKFYDGTDGREELKKLIKKCNLKEEQVSYAEDTFELLDTSYVFRKQDICILVALWLVCGTVIYGVYRICIMCRRKEYGLLQAIGVRNKKIFLLMFKELGVLYILSIIIGSFLGLFFAYGINMISQSAETTFIFWGKKQSFHLAIPWKLVIISYCLMACAILLIVFASYRKIKKETILQKLKENESQVFIKHHKLFLIKHKSRFTSVLLALKSVVRDSKATLLIVLSISLASALVISLRYEAILNKKLDKEKYKVESLDGNFRLQEYNDLTTVTGIDKESVEQLRRLPEVSSVETAMLMPSRLVQDKNKKVNKEYIESLNCAFEDTFYQSISGYDGTDYVYKNSLKGFDENALEKLRDYVIEGDYNPKKLSGKDIILFMPQIGKEGGAFGFIKNGIRIMNCKVGDKITIKFRKDLDVSSHKYWELKDTKEDYNYCTFKIKAIVYCPYMEETSAIGSLIPDIILSEQQFKKITGISVYSIVNVNTSKQQISDKKALQNKISLIAQNNKGVSSRNITDEKNNKANMLTKENIYKHGVAMIAYGIAVLNIINIIRYKVLSRRRELNIYRTIGFREGRLIQLSAVEGIIYGVLSAIVTFFVYLVYAGYIYNQQKQDCINYGLGFQLEYAILVGAIIFNLLVCVAVSVVELERDKKTDIVENMNRIR